MIEANDFVRAARTESGRDYLNRVARSLAVLTDPARQLTAAERAEIAADLAIWLYQITKAAA